MAIPKIIHQIFLGEEPSLLMKRHMDRLRNENPSWDYRLYDDARARDFILEHYGARLGEVYDRINPLYPAARSDFLRYLILHTLGGVYLDVRCGTDRPLDAIVRSDDDYVLCGWDHGSGGLHEGFGHHDELAVLDKGEFQQWHVIAAPGAPYLRRVIDRVMTRIETYDPVRDGVGWIGVLRLTGPIPYTLAIAPILEDHPHRYVRTNAELGLVYASLSASEAGMADHHYSQQTTPIVL